MAVERQRLLPHWKVPSGQRDAARGSATAAAREADSALTMLTHGIQLVAAVEAVGDGVAEGVLRQTLSTVAAEALVVAGNVVVAPGFVGAIGTLPPAIAHAASRQACAVVARERLSRTPGDAAATLCT